MIIELNNGREINIRIEKRNENLYEYYINNTKIGVYQKGVMEDNILILQNTIENEISSQIKDKIDYIDRDEILKEAEQSKKIEDYAIDELGIERIKDILIVDIENKDDKEQEDDSKNDKYKKVEKDEKTKEIEKATTKDVNIKQEINSDKRADDMHNMRNWLGNKIPSEYTKIGIIESYDMDQMKDENGKSYKNDSTRYSLVVIDKNNNIEPLKKFVPELEQRDSAGNNPTRGSVQVDAYGRVEDDPAIVEWQIGDKVLEVDLDERSGAGTLGLYTGKQAHGSTETLVTRVNSDEPIGTGETANKKVVGAYESVGEYVVDKGKEEYKSHNKGENNLTYKDVDGEEESKSHLHIENLDNEKLKEIAGKWGMHDRDGRPDIERVKAKLEEEIGNKAITEQELDNIVDDVTEELEEDYNGPNRNR